jgi:hypothetical protein
VAGAYARARRAPLRVRGGLRRRVVALRVAGSLHAARRRVEGRKPGKLPRATTHRRASAGSPLQLEPMPFWLFNVEEGGPGRGGPRTRRASRDARPAPAGRWGSVGGAQVRPCPNRARVVDDALCTRDSSAADVGRESRENPTPPGVCADNGYMMVFSAARYFVARRGARGASLTSRPGFGGLTTSDGPTSTLYTSLRPSHRSRTATLHGDSWARYYMQRYNSNRRRARANRRIEHGFPESRTCGG